MSWNYRVIKTSGERYGEEYSYYAIHEVYHDMHGNIDRWSVDPIEPVGETLEELTEDLNHMMIALKEPVLEVHGDLLVEVHNGDV